MMILLSSSGIILPSKVADGTFDCSADRIKSFDQGRGVNHMSCAADRVKSFVQGRGVNHMSCAADRVKSFVQGRGVNHMSCAGREVLLKANAQAVLTYPMSCFKLLAQLCKKMKNYISNYLWGSSVDSHKIHRQRWSKLTGPNGEGGMGFRDLPLFNKAQLGKQGWRLMVKPDSLCARVLQGKYYPHGDFLSASRKKKASETWRAILYGREVLLKGAIKRVGPGTTVNIWKDNWLPGGVDLKPLVRLDRVDLEQVSELFIPGTRSWNEDLIRASFVSCDADELLKLRPGFRMEEDLIAWNSERNGLYTVTSAYRLLKAEQSQIEAGKLNETSSSTDSLIWKLCVPPKIRIFWWRAVNNFLPTKAELNRRHVEEESFCPTCGAEAKTLHHVAFVCPLAKRFWQSVERLRGFKVPDLHPVSWVKDALVGGRCTEKEAAILACGVWSLWTGRNARKHGKAHWDHSTAVRHISSMLEDMICSTSERSAAATLPAKRRAKWQKPDQGWVKVNTDATFDAATENGASGAVMRNDRGEFVAASARAFSRTLDVLMAEALAARDGVKMALEHGGGRVCLELDNTTVASLLQWSDGNRSIIYNCSLA
jgi:hypothetical protein